MKEGEGNSGCAILGFEFWIENEIASGWHELWRKSAFLPIYTRNSPAL